MINFILKYGSLFLVFLPLYFLVVFIHPVLVWLLCLFVLAFYRLQGKNRHLILNFFIVLIFADHFRTVFDTFAALRSVIVVAMTFFSIFDLIKKKYRLNNLFLLIVPFIACASFSAIYASPIPLVALIRSTSYLMVFFISTHFIYFELKRNNYEFFRDILYFTAWVFLLGIILMQFLDLYYIYRYKGIFRNPNGVGLYSIISFIFYFIYWQARKYRPDLPKLPLLFFFVLMIFSLIEANSRNALGSIIIIMGVFWVLNSRPFFKFLYLGVFLPLGIFIISNFSIVEIINFIGLGEYLRVESLEDGSGRSLSWAFALTIIPQKLYWGGGFYYEQYVYLNYVSEPLQIFREMSSSWSTYFALMLNTGLVGTSVFVITIIKFLGFTKHRVLGIAIMFGILFSMIYEAWLSASLNSYTIYLFISITILNDEAFWVKQANRRNISSNGKYDNTSLE